MSYFSSMISLIEKLDYHNYSVWCTCMKSYLQGQNLWEIVGGNETKPPLNSAPEDQEKWKVKAGQALFIIKSTVDKSLLSHIEDAETPKEAWDIFAILFLKNSMSELQRLQRELMTISQGDMTVSDYFLKVKGKCKEIEQLDVSAKIDEGRMRRIILKGIRVEYGAFITAIQGCAAQSSLIELENLLSRQEALIKELGVKAVKQDEDNILDNGHHEVSSRDQYMEDVMKKAPEKTPIGEERDAVASVVIAHIKDDEDRVESNDKEDISNKQSFFEKPIEKDPEVISCEVAFKENPPRSTKLETISKEGDDVEMTLGSKELPDARATKLCSDQSKLEVGESSGTKIMDDGDKRDNIPCLFDAEKIVKVNPRLALCSYSLSLFPENFKLKKRFIIYWWIGLELVQAESTKTAEGIGEIVFHDLVNLGILVPVKVTDSVGYIIEPKSHTKLVTAAKGEHLFKGSCFGRHNQFRFYTIKTNQRNVGINIDENYLISESLQLEMAKKDFHVHGMQLGQCSMEPRHIEVDNTDFLKELKPCLTYLSLQGISRITELPDSIGNLENLIVLDLRACHNLEKLPRKIKPMNKLTHLDVSMCYLLDHLPKWVGSLSNLEVLKGFVIGSSGNSDRCRLTDLANLEKLRKLSMTVGRESEVVSEKWLCMTKLAQLRSLTIIWGAGKNKKTTKYVSPPENLEKLDFWYHHEEVMPDEWFRSEVLKKIKKLYIRGGQLKKFGHEIHEMATVEILRLRYLNNFEMPLHDILLQFPNLNCLELVECNKIVKINTVDGFWRKERDVPLPEITVFWREERDAYDLPEIRSWITAE